MEMSSTEERIEVLEAQSVIQPRISDCIFCHLDPYGHNNTIRHKITDNAVREFLNKNDVPSCNHEKAGSWTLGFSDFLNGCLIEESTDLKKQNDYDFNYSLFQNKRVMIPRIESEAERKIKVLTENVLGLIPEEREDERAYWKSRIANIPVFVRLAKQLYEKIYE